MDLSAHGKYKSGILRSRFEEQSALLTQTGAWSSFERVAMAYTNTLVPTTPALGQEVEALVALFPHILSWRTDAPHLLLLTEQDRSMERFSGRFRIALARPLTQLHIGPINPNPTLKSKPGQARTHVYPRTESS